MSEEPTVVGLFGAVPATNEPNVEVVAELEELLADAKAGAISGLGYFVITHNHRISSNWTGNARGILYVAGAKMLEHRCCAGLLTQEEANAKIDA